VVLSGRLSVRRADRAGVAREIRELTVGSVSGMLPYSRLSNNPAGYIVADGPAELLLVAGNDIREMTARCYDFTAICVHEMLDRARVFKSDDLQLEKMASLGRLSAGIAHELNNPSSALGRSASEMEACRLEMVAAAEALGRTGLDAGRRAAVETLEAAVGHPVRESLSPVAQADREDAIAAWLVANGVEGDLAGRLTSTGVSLADLDAARAALSADELAVALRFVALSASITRLTTEMGNAARRIQGLVAAVKKHTHMDRAPSVEAIDLEPHLRDTLILVGSEARARGVVLELDVEPALPPVLGVVGELNQVWLNLLDNAIDAAPEHGHVLVRAAADRGAVIVRVIDDGPGIPEQDRERIFDPFFTTKPVGQGAGLGLDVVRTIVQKHRGTVQVDSRPGRTEFQVCLPTAEPRR